MATPASYHGVMLGGGRSIQLARVFGIRIGVDASWFIFLFVVIWFRSQAYKDQFPGHDDRAFAFAVVFAYWKRPVSVTRAT